VKWKDVKEGESLFCKRGAHDFDNEGEVLAYFQRRAEANALARTRLQQPDPAEAARGAAMPAPEAPRATDGRLQSLEQTVRDLQATVRDLQAEVTRLQGAIRDVSEARRKEAAIVERLCSHFERGWEATGSARDGVHPVGAGR